MVKDNHSQELTELLGRARALHADGKTREAVELLESGDRFRDSARFWAFSAHLQYLLEQYDTAKIAADRALELDPRNRLALQTLGEIEMKAGRFPEAETWFREAIASNPRSTHPYLRLAAVYLAQLRYADAADILYRGLEKFSGHAQLLERLQYALTMDGRIREAGQIRKTRRMTASRDAPDMRAFLNRFEGLPIDRAIDQLKLLASMEHYRDEPLLHDQLARYLIERERFPEAVPHLESVIRFQPRNNHARLNLAYCLFKTGASERAWGILSTMESYRNDTFFNLVKIEGFIVENRLKEALEMCIEQLRLHPRDKRLRKALQFLKRKGVQPKSD
jgi:tetratricopeptide (TPR) repeat protein